MRQLIQNKLVEYIKNSQTFFAVTYDDDNLASLKGSAQLGSDVLASCHANETAANYGVDPNYRRDRRQVKTAWAFELRAVFNQEISVEAFEEAWLSNPPVLTREDTSSKQVTLLLQSAEIKHPPQQSSSTGTKVVFTILAELSRN